MFELSLKEKIMVISHIFTSLGLDEVQKITIFGIFARNGVFFGKKMERESPKIIEKSKKKFFHDFFGGYSEDVF